VDAEVDEVVKRFPAAEVVNNTSDAIQTLEQPIGLLHVASHASSRSDNPMYSSLELADGPLLATEIARSGGNCKMVVLSACDTGRMSLRQKMEPDGLVRSFLALGAETVVASQWPLDDAASRTTMAGLYAELAQRSDAKVALSTGKRICREQFEHPYFWSPLTIYGGYRKRIQK
jgi:CHAT domain-containing protein